MTNALIAILASAFCACGSSPVDPAKASTQGGATVVLRDFAPDQGANLRKPLLRAAGGPERKLEPGTVRVPIPVDGVLYEVIVVKPQLGTMIPVGRDASE